MTPTYEDLPHGYQPPPRGLTLPRTAAGAPSLSRAGAVLIQRTPMFDDDGTGEVGTVLNDAWKQELYNQIDVALAAVGGSGIDVIYVSGVTGTMQLTLAPNKPVHVVVLSTLTGAVTINGANTVAAGERLLIVNHSDHTVFLANGVAPVPIPFWNGVSSGPIPLVSWWGWAEYVSAAAGDGFMWRILGYSQGYPTDIPSTAFTAASGILTVSTNASQYYVSQNQLYIYFNLTGSLSATSASVILAVPNGYMAFRANLDQPVRVNTAWGLARPETNQARVTLWSSPASGNFTSGAVTLAGRITYPLF